mgnify:CR=1 FL=1
MKILDVNIKPLPRKHYSTDLIVDVEVEGDDYTLVISIAGYAPKPSIREMAKGWEPDYGMDHVESESHYMIAQQIELALTALSEKHKMEGEKQ